jgi:peptide/nickel transport system substrate-binding protein
MLKIQRRNFLIASASLLAFPAIARAAGDAPMKGGMLRVSVDQAASVIHPLLTRVNPEYLVTELLYSNLTRLKVDMSVEPDLAESWSPNDDLSKWTVKLRKGVKFHNGADLSADDVVATFKAILDPKNASPGAKNVGPIKEIAAVDPNTVLFTLASPYSDFPVALAYTNARIISADDAKNHFSDLSTKPNGTGPFKLVSYEPDRKIVVERNPNYYDPARPYLDRIEINVFADIDAEGSALISGDTDLMSTVAPTQFLRLKAVNDVEALRVPSGQFCNVNFGCDTKLFSDPRVRRALALTVDRKAMVDFVVEGLGTPGNDTPINAAYRYYDNLPIEKPDIAQAKQLLAAAGHKDGFEVTLVASDRPAQRTQLAVALQEMVKQIGVKINVQTMPHATYLAQVWKKGDFYVGFYNMQPTADGIFSLLYTSDASWDETRWHNKDFDKLVYAARGTIDGPKRKKLYDDAQKLMQQQVPSIIPVFFDVLGAKRKWVEGYQAHPRASVFRLDYVSLGKDAPGRH